MNTYLPALAALLLVPQFVLADIVAPPEVPLVFEEAAKLTLSVEVNGEPVVDLATLPLSEDQPLIFKYSIGYKDSWFYDPHGEFTDQDRAAIFDEEIARKATFLSLWRGMPLSPEAELIQSWNISGQRQGILDTTLPLTAGDDYFFLFDIPNYLWRDPGGACTISRDPIELCLPEATLGMEQDEALNYIRSSQAIYPWEGGDYAPLGFGGVRFSVPETATSSGASNVLFLPGLQGSRLYEKVLGVENRRWELTPVMSQKDARALYLNPGGTSRNAIYTKEGDIVAHAEVPFGGFDVYRTFIDLLGSLKQEGVIEDFLSYPYDWRMDPVDVVERGTRYEGGTRLLTEEVQALAATSATGKVTVVGHSNGGLVAKALMRKLEREGQAHLVDSVVLVSAPQLGTPQALAPMLHGDFGALTSFGGLYLDKGNARGLAEHMPDAYALLPSSGYFARVSDPVVDLTKAPALRAASRLKATVTTPKDLASFLSGNGRKKPQPGDVETPNTLSPSLYAKAGTTHAALDSWNPPDGVRVVQIAGWGLDTTKGIAYEERKKKDCTLLVLACRETVKLSHRALMTGEGDGTVVGISQLSTLGETYVINLEAANRAYEKNWRHADITETQPFQALFREMLNGPVAALPEHVAAAPGTVPGERLRLRVLSPVALHAYDGEGRHTGPVALSGTDLLYKEEQIPNSYYEEFGEGKYLGLPADSSLRIELQGLDSGTFTYEVERASEGGSKVVTYPDLPVTASTTAVMDIANGNIASATLRLDVNGDGAIDAQVEANRAETPLSYVRLVVPMIASMGLPAVATRQLVAKFTNIEHLLRKTGKWESIDDDNDRNDVRKGERIERRVLRKIDRVDLWIALDRLRAKLPLPFKRFVRPEVLDPHEAEALLAMTARLRALLK